MSPSGIAVEEDTLRLRRVSFRFRFRRAAGSAAKPETKDVGGG